MTTLNYVIVVNDAGELKTVSAQEIENALGTTAGLAEMLDTVLNAILDRRAIDAGEYDPADNSLPLAVIMGEPT